MEGNDLVILYTESHTLDGCDRVALDEDGQVLVQGKHRNPDGFTSIRVPDGEALVSISPEALLAAARELKRRRGRQ